MDMKRVIEQNVPEGEDLVKKILHFAKESSWIWISKDLTERLKKYKYHPYAPNVTSFGIIFYIPEEEEGKDPKILVVMVDDGTVWNKICCIYEQDMQAKMIPTDRSGLHCPAADPEILVFLS